MKRIYLMAYLLLLCSSLFAQDRVYWGDQDADNIKSVLASDLTSSTTPVPSAANPSGLAYFQANPTYPLFFASGSAIYRNDLASTSNLIITPSNQFNRGVAIDYVGQKIYWANSQAGFIGRANLDGSSPTETFITGLTSPWDIEIDLVNQKIYWTEDIATGGNIKRANLSDGGSIEPVVLGITGGALGLAVDPLRGGKLYYTTFGNGKVFSANLSGTGSTEIAGLSAIADIDVDYITGRIYTVDYGTDQLTKSDPDGGNKIFISGANGLFIEYADVTAPNITFINRQNPGGSGPTPSAFVGGAATFRVAFSEPMLNVDVTDFELAGTATGTLSLVAVGSAKTLYDVTVTGIGGAGPLNLNVAAANNLIDFRGNAFNGTVTTDQTYTITAGSAPTVTSFLATSGIEGDAITITGTNFSPNSSLTNNTVKFNGVTAVVTAVSGGTSITALVPAGATTGPISVTYGGLTGTSGSNFTLTCTSPPIPTISRNETLLTSSSATGNQWFRNEIEIVGETNQTYTVFEAGDYTVKVTVSGCTSTSAITLVTEAELTPSITSFSPTLGPVGTTVTITGTSFSSTPASNAVTFNGVTATVTASTTTSITTTVPATATTGVIVVVVGGRIGTSSTNFTVTGPPPTVTSFSPTSGPVGTTVTITGTNFSTTPGNNTVTFNGTAATVTASSSTSITTTVPVAATTGTIAVTVGGQTGTSSTNFTVTIPPTVTSFTPTSGPIGTTVTITGTNFSTTPGNNTVTFNATAATVSASTATSITTAVPAAATTGNIDVTVGGLTGTSSTVFTVTAPSTPSITSFAPGSGPIGTTVTITGTNFSATPGNNTVTFNGTAATVTASSSTSITTTVPVAATTGPIAVTVGGLTGTSSTNFTVTAASTPTVTSFTPVSGPIGTTVTITGTNFSATPGNNTVTFNGTTATVTVSTTTTITTTVPAAATSGPIAVTVAALTGTSATNFTVTAASTPTITSFSPISGAVGTTVTITGTNFSATPANNTVQFNGVTATVSASTTTSITTLVPVGAVSGTISVTVGGLTGASGTNFTVTAGPTPTIISFSPTSGPIGTSVTITGTNFSATPASNTVKFNGVTATVTASTTTSITTTVPATATTGTISVTVAGLTAISATNFTVTAGATPTITSFSPTSGPIGTSVTITGTNFSATPANNTVKFNGVTATVAGSSITSITTTVPASATTGTITVTVGGLTGTSASNFTVTVATPPTITSFAPILGPIGTTVTITGTNFSTTPGNNTVTFNGVSATVTASSTTSITTTVPATATTGAIAVTVAGLTATSASNFNVTCTPPPKPTITSDGGLLTSSSATGNQWLRNGFEISGATSQTFAATEGGAYTVRVTVGGCSSQSDPTTITAIERDIAALVSVYPNPALSILRIEIDSYLPDGKAEVFSMTGMRKDGVQLLSEAGKLKGEIDVKGYSAGLYIVVVSTDEFVRVVKLKKD